MPATRVGESFPVPDDPVEKAAYLVRNGMITTPELNRMRTFTPEKAARFKAHPEERDQELDAAMGSIQRVKDSAKAASESSDEGQ